MGWHKLAQGNEDFPSGSADFYHRCHFSEHSEYCMYGHVVAIAYVAKYANHVAKVQLAHTALRLLHWNHCLDFLESSSWGISLLDIWDMGNGFSYPQVTKMHQYITWGPGSGGVIRSTEETAS